MVELFLRSFFDFLQYGGISQLGSIALAWVILFRGLAWEKGKRLRYLVEFILYFAVLWIVFTIPILLLHEFNSVIWLGLHAITSFSYVWIIVKSNKQAKFVLWCSLYAGICCLSMIASQVEYLIVEYVAGQFVGIVVRHIFYLLALPLAFYLRQFNLGKFETVPKVGYLLVLAGNVSIVALAIVEEPWMRTDYRIVLTLLASVLCLFIIVLIIIFAVYTMCKEQSEIIALQTEKQRLISERELVRLTESNLEDLRCIRHDLKNQYAYMRLLLQQKKYGELEDYFNQRSESVSIPISYIDCGNRIIDNVLNMEIAKAKREEVSVEHQLIVPPELPFADDDVCAILANLMDNAIEECKRLQMKRAEQVSIKISMHPYGSYLYIVCRNTTDRQKLNRINNALQTTKGDAQFHGYGTRIVAKIAEKYNGSADYSLKDGYFVAKVIMDMTVEEK